MLLRLLAALFLTLLIGAQPAEAQFWKKAREAAKRGAERAIERETASRADRAVTGMFELGDDAVGCVVGDDACVRQARDEGKEVVYVDEEGTPLPADQQSADTPSSGPGSDENGSASETMRPGEGAWANYDFVPGHRVLFTDSFENDYVGDFPRRLTFRRGAMETVEGTSGRMLRAKTDGAFDIVLPETLPDRFTLEFDFYTEGRYNDIRVYTLGVDDERAANNHVVVDPLGGVGIGSYEHGGIESTLVQQRLTEAFYPVRVSVDGSYVKVYVAEERVANVPNAELGRTNRLRFDLYDVRESNGPVFIDNIRIAAGGREMMYDRLMADGRIATHGVLFDTGSATIRPESTPTLKEIARTLQQHGDLRLRIEGHTDNTGSADANRQLSERRAAAVRDYLVQHENIDESRLESAGMGQAAPTADNGTPEGRQTNRRVELVVL